MPTGEVALTRLDEAARLAGSGAALARALGVSEASVRRWRRGAYPAARAAEVEAYLGGEVKAKVETKAKAKAKVKRPAKVRDLERALALAGSAGELGRQVLATPGQVLRWKAKGEVPEGYRGPLREYLVAAEAARSKLKSPKKELETAIRLAGGVEAFMVRFGIRQKRTVKRWLEQGPSRKGMALLIGYHQLRQSERLVKVAGDERLDLLLGFMTKEDEELLNVKSSSARREGDLTEGWRWTKRWRRTLTQSLIDEVFAWCATRKKGHPRWDYWHGAMLSIQFDPEGRQGPVGLSGPDGLKRKTDYVILGVRQVEGVSYDKAKETQEKIRDFLIPLRHGTYRKTTALGVAEHMRELLTQVMESGNYAHVVSTTLYNYRVRSDEERRKRAAERTKFYRDRRKAERRSTGGRDTKGATGRRR